MARGEADIGAGVVSARSGAADRRGASPRPRPTELWYALAAIAAVTVLYVIASRQTDAFPSASGIVGHGIGVVGFILMLMAATLYSLRKLGTDARWGSVAGWLRFHMVSGLVGPYMVLLHTAMKFQGLAGLAMLLTVVTVVSGIVGRYLYTRLPREIGEDGAAAGERELARRRRSLIRRRKAFATWHILHVPLVWALFLAAFMHVFAELYYVTLGR